MKKKLKKEKKDDLLSQYGDNWTQFSPHKKRTLNQDYLDIQKKQIERIQALEMFKILPQIMSPDTINIKAMSDNILRVFGVRDFLLSQFSLKECLKLNPNLITRYKQVE